MLVLGTSNRGKVREMIPLLAPLGIEVRSLTDYSQALEVEETGDSFATNARLKASQQAMHLGAWVLAEDSGLVVDALGGRPGIYSARFSGPNATDEANNRLLLAELGDTPPARRTAHYACHVALADPLGAVRAEAAGACYGRIALQAAGSAGFGYDPLFEVVEYHRTAAELGETVKSVISHRARALEGLLPQLYGLAREMRS